MKQIEVASIQVKGRTQQGICQLLAVDMQKADLRVLRWMFSKDQAQKEKPYGLSKAQLAEDITKRSIYEAISSMTSIARKETNILISEQESFNNLNHAIGEVNEDEYKRLPSAKPSKSIWMRN